MRTLDIIGLDEVATLPALFRARVARSPEAIAYRAYDAAGKRWYDTTWAQAAERVARLQAALAREALQPGDRVGIMLRNCPEWVLFEQAAQGLGLVVVPLYCNDRPESIAYILQNAGVRLLLLEDPRQLDSLQQNGAQLSGLRRIVSLLPPPGEPRQQPELVTLQEWLPAEHAGLQAQESTPDQLVTIVFTSGTTGRPKGVMLSHRNILCNAFAGIDSFPIYREDLLLSFLPLSHMLERTLGYYIPIMAGATVAFARSVQDLAEDLVVVRPTVLISVPRIYERVYNKIQSQLRDKSPIARSLFAHTVAAGWQGFKTGHAPWYWPVLNALVAKKVMAKLGGRLRLAICGGAPLSGEVARTFIGLGLNMVQGYGLTETSPIISGNPEGNNDPTSVGVPLRGIEVSVGEHDELLTRGPCVMLGYWDNPEATRAIIDAEGWLHTGDQVRMENGHIYITGRLKEIIVMSTGKKVPPADMELAIAADGLFDQVMIVGEGRPFLAALVVLNPERWKELAGNLKLDANDPQALYDKAALRALLDHLGQHLDTFPSYAQIKRVWPTLEPWTIEAGLLTPTLKPKRSAISARYQAQLDALYVGH